MYFLRKASFGALFIATAICYIHLGIQQAATYPQSGTVQRYFSTPEQSVEVIAKLTQARDWETLASFQYVPMNNDELSSLFIQPVTYKEAILPPAGDIEVVLAAKSDNGEISPETFGTYKLRAFPEGYQLIPKGTFSERPPQEPDSAASNSGQTASSSETETAPDRDS